MFVNYDECILSYVAAIRGYFGLDSVYKADARFKALLEEKRPEKIFIVLIDGMGSRLIKRKLSQDGFLLSHLYTEVSTVFPPTTVAATTSIKNGKSPNMNGYLGWTSYIKEVDDIVTIFMDEGYYTKKKYPDLIEDILPVRTTVDELREKGISAIDIEPFYIRDGGYDGLETFADRIIEASFSNIRYAYAYYDKYDSLMHKEGVDHKKCDDLLCDIERELQRVADDLSPDTLLVIVADHGLVDIGETINIFDTKLKDHLRRPIAIEGRAAAFYIKDGEREVFTQEFKELFEDDFILLEKEDVKKSKLFGDGIDHERFDEFIGDFIAIAKSDKDMISKVDPDFFMKAAHAGVTKDEMMIPVILYMKEGRS